MHGRRCQLLHQASRDEAETDPEPELPIRQNAASEVTQLRPVPQRRHLQMNFSYYWLEKQCGLWPAPNQPSIRVTRNSIGFTYMFSKLDLLFFFQTVFKKRDALLYSIFISYSEKRWYIAVILSEDSRERVFWWSLCSQRVLRSLFSASYDVQPSSGAHISKKPAHS